MNQDPIFQPACRQAGLIRRGELSSEALVAASLERIRQVNPQLNAVVRLDGEAALAEARLADKEQASGKWRGPLHGLPMTIKDSFDTAGLVTTWGMASRRNRLPSRDATVVSRLKAAGAILLGKTNTPELTFSYSTSNLVYGRTSNPHDLSRSPGGSSGGAAAVVAAGGSSFDIGSDTGGSIRLPAHMCGICGLRPTSGRVPRTGHAIPPGGPLDALTQVGPLARSAADLALILPVIAGPDGIDSWVQPVPLGDPEQIQLKGRRAAYFTDNGICPPTREVISAVEKAAEILAQAGMRVEQACPPGLAEGFEIYTDLYLGWTVPWVRSLLESEGIPLASSTIEDLEGPLPDGTALLKAFERWERFRRRMLAFMQAAVPPYDLLLSPVIPCPAYPHGSLTDADDGFSYLVTFSLAGWPVVVVPVSWTAGGLPIGVQVAAQPWQEALALRAAACLEEAGGGWRRPPI